MTTLLDLPDEILVMIFNKLFGILDLSNVAKANHDRLGRLIDEKISKLKAFVENPVEGADDLIELGEVRPNKEHFYFGANMVLRQKR